MEAVGKHDNRFDERGSRRLDADLADERAIDFQRIDRHPVQVRQRGVTGAEIIDGNRNAELLQLLDLPRANFEVIHQDAFGDFNAQASAADSVRFQSMLYDLDELRLGELNAGNVDIHPHVFETRGTPLLNLPACG